MHFSCGGRREHIAGKRLREIMEKHHMRATSAEQGGSTWFGDGGGSTLNDYSWAPEALPIRCSSPFDVWRPRYSSSTRAS